MTLAEMARREGVSLTQLVLTKLAESGRQKTSEPVTMAENALAAVMVGYTGSGR